MSIDTVADDDVTVADDARHSDMEEYRDTLRQIQIVREETATELHHIETIVYRMRLLMQRVDILERKHAGTILENKGLRKENDELRRQNAAMADELASLRRSNEVDRAERSDK